MAISEDQAAGEHPSQRAEVRADRRWAIIKVGGSILLSEQGRIDVAFARGLAEGLSKYDGPMVVVHGAGPVGRSVLARCRVTSDFLSADDAHVAEEFNAAVEAFSKRFVRELSIAGASCERVDPRALLTASSGLVSLTREDALRVVARDKPVVVLHGAALPEGAGGFYCCSGDEVVTAVARAVGPRVVVFLTNVDGVYSPFPLERPEQRPLPEVDGTFLDRVGKKYVVGQSDMPGKVTQAVFCAMVAEECCIANGRRTGILPGLLRCPEEVTAPFTRVSEGRTVKGDAREANEPCH